MAMTGLLTDASQQGYATGQGRSKAATGFSLATASSGCWIAGVTGNARAQVRAGGRERVCAGVPGRVRGMFVCRSVALYPDTRCGVCAHKRH